MKLIPLPVEVYTVLSGKTCSEAIDILRHNTNKAPGRSYFKIKNHDREFSGIIEGNLFELMPNINRMGYYKNYRYHAPMYITGKVLEDSSYGSVVHIKCYMHPFAIVILMILLAAGFAILLSGQLEGIFFITMIAVFETIFWIYASRIKAFLNETLG